MIDPLSAISARLHRKRQATGNMTNWNNVENITDIVKHKETPD